MRLSEKFSKVQFNVTLHIIYTLRNEKNEELYRNSYFY